MNFPKIHPNPRIRESLGFRDIAIWIFCDGQTRRGEVEELGILVVGYCPNTTPQKITTILSPEWSLTSSGPPKSNYCGFEARTLPYFHMSVCVVVTGVTSLLFSFVSYKPNTTRIPNSSSHPKASPKGRQLEVEAQRALRLLVPSYC